MSHQFFDEWFGEMFCVPALGFAIVGIRWPVLGIFRKLGIANKFLFV